MSGKGVRKTLGEKRLAGGGHIRCSILLFKKQRSIPLTACLRKTGKKGVGQGPVGEKPDRVTKI